jgi:hypothetical protein
MAEKVVLEIDVNGLANSVLQAKANVDSYKLSVEALTEAYGENSKEVTIATAQLQAATKEQKQLEGQLLRTTQAQQALGESIIDLSEAYDAENKSIDQNRKVYNALYAEYIKADKAGREKLQPTMKKINDTLKEQEKAVGDTRRNVGNYSEGFKDAIGSIISGVPALKGFQTAQLGVNAAMNANPIGAVVMLLTGLFEVFKQNADIADTVSFAIDGVTKALGYVIDTVVDTVTNFDKLTKAIANPFKFFYDMAKGTAEAAKEGYNAAAALDELTVANARTNAEIKRNQSNIDALTKSLKDKTKEEKERIAIANKIADLEISNSKKTKLAAEEALRIEKLKLKDRKLSGEQQAKLIELESDVQQAADEEKTISAQRQTRINILLEKEKTDNLRGQAKTREQIYAEEQNRLNKIADENARLEKIYIEATKEGLEQEQALYELAWGKIYNDLVAAKVSQVRIAEIKANELLAIQKKYTKEVVDLDKQEKERLEQQSQQAQEKQDEFVDKAASSQMEIILYYANLLGNYITDTLSQASQLVNAFAEQNIEALTRQKDEGILAEAEYNRQVYDLKVKAFKETKALNITQAVIATLQASLNAFNSGLQAGGPFGIVLGAIFAATAAAFGGAQIALIAKQQPPAPQFAEGGGIDIEGKSHSEGGEDVYVGGRRVANIEGGEKMFILKKSASRHIDALGGLNMAFGGRSWKDSPVSHAAQGGAITDGGFAIRATSQEANTIATLNTFAETIVSRLPAPVVSITEFENKQKSKNKSVRVSEL